LLYFLVDDETLKTGCSLRWQQFYAMLVKKTLFTFRNWMLFAAQLVIPIVFLIVCLIVVQTIPGIEDSKPLTATLEVSPNHDCPIMGSPMP